ncbi:hypothetical protein LEP1GSC132_3061 [Leptospira kirschneri str. 200803703]|nr:hypothetical protein LEP1GSC132_3061 [Leptospira kirschneri str. 200803703]
MKEKKPGKKEQREEKFLKINDIGYFRIFYDEKPPFSLVF